MVAMVDVNRLVVSDEEHPSIFERMGPYVVMVDESYKRAMYPPHVWYQMDRFERRDHAGLYAVSAVQIRADGGEKSPYQQHEMSYNPNVL